MAEVAAPVVRELRLALLAPAELSALEEENRREPLIPVCNQASIHSATWGRGGGHCGQELPDCVGNPHTSPAPIG